MHDRRNADAGRREPDVRDAGAISTAHLGKSDENAILDLQSRAGNRAARAMLQRAPKRAAFPRLLARWPWFWPPFPNDPDKVPVPYGEVLWNQSLDRLDQTVGPRQRRRIVRALKLEIIQDWKSARARGDRLVKVLAKSRAKLTPSGYVGRGYVVLESTIRGQSVDRIERTLGLAPNYLGGEMVVQALKRLPTPSEFEPRGGLNLPPGSHPNYRRGAVGDLQFELTNHVPVQPVATVKRPGIFGPPTPTGAAPKGPKVPGGAVAKGKGKVPAPPKPGGPTTTKTNTRVAGGATLAILGVNVVLNWNIESGNEERIDADLKRTERRRSEQQDADPTRGFLVAFGFEGGVTSGEGPSAAARYHSLSWVRGYTEAEALAEWNRRQKRPLEYRFAWVPPAVQPSPWVLAMPFRKVAIGAFARPDRLSFQRVQFKQVGGFDTAGRDGPVDAREWAGGYRFVILRMPSSIGYVNAAGRTSEKSVQIAERNVAGGTVPVVMLDDTPAVAVWPADEATADLFSRGSTPIDDKVKALRHVVGIEYVRWLAPDQVRITR